MPFWVEVLGRGESTKVPHFLKRIEYNHLNKGGQAPNVIASETKI